LLEVRLERRTRGTKSPGELVDDRIQCGRVAGQASAAIEHDVVALLLLFEQLVAGTVLGHRRLARRMDIEVMWEIPV
jgi:hypothetical protein